ncbi:MAG TPA: PrgI family protein, partial [Candidatus Saccharimonadales bacterium]
MATYKVIQDIEAEDKLVGPLTFRQFVYAGIAALNFYLTFLVVSKGVGFVAIMFFPTGLVFAFLAWPWSRDQPTEIWALARFRFLLKPRRRVWDQSGVKELVTITVPAKIERNLTNGLTQSEVKSRLRALADTIDSRGWAIKNVNVSLNGRPALIANDPNSDRLVNINSLPQPVETIDVRPTDDMLDVQNNPVAQQFDSMIAASEKAHRAEVMEKMQAASQPAPAAPAPPPIAAPAQPKPLQSQPANNYWFLNQPSQATSSIPGDNVTFNTQVVAPGASSATLPVAAATPTADEESFIKSHRNEPAFSPNLHGHLHVIQPL